MDKVSFLAIGPRPGGVVHVVLDGAVHRGRVHSVVATVGVDDDPRKPCKSVAVRVRVIDVDGDPMFVTVPADGCYESAVDACNAAFGGVPEPELW